MATQTDSSAGFTANNIVSIINVLDAELNSVILQGQLIGTNPHNLLNFQSNLKDMCRHIYGDEPRLLWQWQHPKLGESLGN